MVGDQKLDYKKHRLTSSGQFIEEFISFVYRKSFTCVQCTCISTSSQYTMEDDWQLSTCVLSYYYQYCLFVSNTSRLIHCQYIATVGIRNEPRCFGLASPPFISEMLLGRSYHLCRAVMHVLLYSLFMSSGAALMQIDLNLTSSFCFEGLSVFTYAEYQNWNVKKAILEGNRSIIKMRLQIILGEKTPTFGAPKRRNISCSCVIVLSCSISAQRRGGV